tara:strand:- start:48 stop:2234 length:2187 start_codon:yes stop_codon:yes gene_type:complete
LKDILLLTPPFTQLNTPYPATAYLKGFLNTKDISSFQSDLGIEVILKLFSKSGLSSIFEFAEQNDSIADENTERIWTLRHHYQKTIDSVILFLQGNNPNLARQICSDGFLPQAERFNQLDDLEMPFGSMGFQDKAKHLATLYLEDISDFIVKCIDSNFGFSRYAERLGKSANSFDELHSHLQQSPTYIDNITLSLLDRMLKKHNPKLVCMSIPFPGNLYSGFRCAQWIKKNYPDIKVAMGGGFPNTELRSITDVRVFNYFDFITLDDGELPVELLFNYLNKKEATELKRTFLLEEGKVTYKNNSALSDYKQSQIGTPNYTDLILDNYISVIEVANPMHSLWSDGRWNKLTMAHGCYWGKCTFCDISLDYIKIYEPIAANILVDRVEELIEQTGESGFHFVDEAAPPSLMKAFALEVLKRKLTITWWTNIRFEKNFTKDLCFLLKASGCIAVSGGLEVASDRLLKLIDKGVTVQQVARVTNHFTQANIMVHSYLMYGYPTQTEQETIDSLEMVRQMFQAGILQSGFWHQFALTAHSPVGINPDAFGIEPHTNTISFANNDVDFTDSTGIDHQKFSFGLKKSLFNFMHQIGFDMPVTDWFDFPTPSTTIDNSFIESCLHEDAYVEIKPTSKIYWIGTEPLIDVFEVKRKGKKQAMMQFLFHTNTDSVELVIDEGKGKWLYQLLEDIDGTTGKAMSLKEVKASYHQQFSDFEAFWISDAIINLREIGLLVL